MNQRFGGFTWRPVEHSGHLQRRKQDILFYQLQRVMWGFTFCSVIDRADAGGTKRRFFRNHHSTGRSQHRSANSRQQSFRTRDLPPLNPVAQGLLKYIPLPNVTPTSFNAQNFRFVTATLSDSDDLNIRINQALGGTSNNRRQRGRRGPRNNLSFGFHYHAASANITNPFPSVGGNTNTRSFDVPVGYTRTFGKLINNARFDFNRSRVRTQNLYAFNQDITGGLGVTGVSTNPFDWGLPNLSFTHFGGLNDVNPQLQRNQTWTFSDSMIYNHGKHTWRWGGDFRRIQVNPETDSNARGTFTFTGVNSGYDFADFLFGLPQLTSVQFGDNNYHFRGNSWDAFVQDEWKLRGNLTLNLGVRYEYFSPFTETNDHIVNLDLPEAFHLSAGTGSGRPVGTV